MAAKTVVKLHFDGEIRRCTFAASEFSLIELKNRVGELYPKLDVGGLRLQWRDNDGDLVTFSTQGELQEALEELGSGQPLKVFLSKTTMEKVQEEEDKPKACGAGGTRVNLGKKSNVRCQKNKDGGLQGEFQVDPKLANGIKKAIRALPGVGEDVDFFKPEQRQKLRDVVKDVVEMAKQRAMVVGGPKAGDCAGDAVAVAVRSTIRRSVVIHRHTGIQPNFKLPQKWTNQNEDDSDDKSGESDEATFEKFSEPEITLLEEDNHLAVVRKRARPAAQEVARFARERVGKSFGKLAGRWACNAVQESMMKSIMFSTRAEIREKNQETRKMKPKDGEMSDTPSETKGQAPSWDSYIKLEEEGFSEPVKSKTKVVTPQRETVERQLQQLGLPSDHWMVDHVMYHGGDIPAAMHNLRYGASAPLPMGTHATNA